ncbi:hypothetical protein MASR1M90_23830 [Desulfovibrionales bacterium]
MSVYFFKSRSCWRCSWYEGKNKKYKYFKTKEEALAFDREHLAHSCSESNRLTLGELAVLFYRSNNIHPQTKRNVVYFLAGHDRDGKHIPGSGEFLRDKFADSLTRIDLEAMREILRARNLSNNTINKYQAYINSILSWGVDEQLLSHHPWREFRRLKIQKKILSVSFSDIQRIISCSPDWLAWAIVTAYALSMRPGKVELFSLTWDSFHWSLGIVQYFQGKSKTLKRVVPPDWYLREAHIRYHEDMKSGIPLVCHRSGRRVLCYKEAWRKAVSLAGLSGIRFYDVRHVSASVMLASGADLPAVSAQLGHSSAQTTATTYAHAVPGAQQRAASLLPSLLPDSDKK